MLPEKATPLSDKALIIISFHNENYDCNDTKNEEKDSKNSHRDVDSLNSCLASSDEIEFFTKLILIRFEIL